MKFWFCEKCGKRITDADFEEGRAADKQANGVYCSSCAAGIATAPAEAVTRETKSTRTGIRPVPRSVDPATISTATTPTAPVPPVSGTSGRNSRVNISPAKPGSNRKGESARDGPNNNLPYMLGGAALALLVAAIYFLQSSPTPQQTAAATPTAAPNGTQSSTPARATHEPPAHVDPKAPASPLLGPRLDPDQQANQAFDELYAKLKGMDKEEQAAELEQFIANYNNSIVASRARKMLSELDKPATPRTANAAAKPVKPPARSPTPPARPANSAPAPAPSAQPDNPGDTSGTAKPNATVPPGAMNTAAQVAYAEFQSEFLNALRARDGEHAKVVLAQAQKNAAFAAKATELTALQPAPDLVTELDAAVTKGVARLKDIEDFTLPVARSAPIHVGKSAEFKFTELKDNEICLAGKGVTLSVSLASLPDSARQQLAQLGFGEGPHAKVLQALTELLATADRKSEAAATLRAGVVKTVAGAPDSDVACLLQLQEQADFVAREHAADLAWKQIATFAAHDSDLKRRAQLKSALDGFRTGFADTAFLAVHAAEIADAELLTQAPDPKGLLLHLKLDELQGTTLPDASGQGNNATAVNSPQIVPGKFGNALSFDGATMYVMLPDELLKKAVSLSLWFNSTASGVIVGHNDAVSPEAPKDHSITAYLGHDGKLYARLPNKAPNHLAAPAPVNEGKWHHLAIVDEKGSQNIYLDGVKSTIRGNVDLTIAPHWQLGTGFIHKTPGLPNDKWFYYKGLLDDVRVYDRTLSDEEIQRLAGKHE